MTTSSLAPPPRDGARRAPPPARGPVSSGPGPRSRRPAPFERVLRWSLLISLVVHAALLLLPGRFMRVDVLSESQPRESPDEFTGLEWVVPVPEGAEGDSPAAGAPAADAAPEQIPPDPRVLRVRPGQAAPQPPTSAPAAERAPGGAGSTRESLRPGYRDPRLYVETDPLTKQEKSDHQKYMEHLQARIDAVNDSMGLAAERERRAKDWTFRDKEGKRWGLSEEGLHLGGVTVPRALVPMPRSTGDNATQEAAREEQRQRDEIRRQEEERERRATQDERARATRERNEAQREQGGGT